nr:DUF1661 domain-containing protein [Porphyromonas gulae]
MSRPCLSEKWCQNFFVPAREFFRLRAKTKNFPRHVFTIHAWRFFQT